MSDQEQISTLLLKGEYDWHKDIQIDYYASMFLNMHMADDYGRCDPEKDVVFSEGRLLNKRTGYVPSMCVVLCACGCVCGKRDKQRHLRFVGCIGVNTVRLARLQVPLQWWQ